jgi:hypothetical protein
MIDISICHKNQECFLSIALGATEVPERRLELELSGVCNVRNRQSITYDPELIRYYCCEGMSHSRRQLELCGGLSVVIGRLSGCIDAGKEIVISHMVAISIAQALRNDFDQALYTELNDWELTLNE